MGLSVVAAHLIVLIAVAGVGTIAVATVVDTLGDNIEARSDAVHRLQTQANEDVTLTSEATQGNRLILEFRNDGSEEINITELTILVDGDWRDPDELRVFEVQEDPSSNVWIPGEHLDVEIQQASNSDVTLIAPHGAKAFRRA